MTSPNSTFSELVTTTFRKHQGSFADNVSNNNALLGRMKTKGRTEKVDGGLSIVEELDYAENGTYQRYSVMTLWIFLHLMFFLLLSTTGSNLRFISRLLVENCELTPVIHKLPTWLNLA